MLISRARSLSLFFLESESFYLFESVIVVAIAFQNTFHLKIY
jgi:hypothetical protein